MSKLLHCRNHPRQEEIEVGAGEGLGVVAVPLQCEYFRKNMVSKLFWFRNVRTFNLLAQWLPIFFLYILQNRKKKSHIPLDRGYFMAFSLTY